MNNQGPSKRRKIKPEAESRSKSSLTSLSRSISPPPGASRAAAIEIKRSDAIKDDSEDENAVKLPRRGTRMTTELLDEEIAENVELEPRIYDAKHLEETESNDHIPPSNEVQDSTVFDSPHVRILPSPIQLTQIRDLPSPDNLDTVSLRDILCDPLIKECWQFNYLIDLDFVMNTLDPDVRNLIQVKIVHGSWKAEDAQRLRLEESAKRYPNVQILIAHMPEAFGTHHSKMMVLIRHDDTAQVVIHTANMIAQDWTNLTQAVWRSPLLPLLVTPPSSTEQTPARPIGTGPRFKVDLLRYLKAYSGRTKPLVDQLKQYNFDSIRAALIASTPSRTAITRAKPAEHTSWGWLGLKEILSIVPCQQDPSKQPSVVIQVSSIATLTEKWFENFFDVLSASSPQGSAPSTNAFFKPKLKKPKFNVIFPTAEEIRQSLDGYASGSSIHMKLQSAGQIKQLALMRLMLCYWMGDTIISEAVADGGEDEQIRGLLEATKHDEPIFAKREAFRGRAAPHIKTYTRFSDQEQRNIQWGMVTSANMSQQAWGAVPDKEEVVRICSYEIGVVVWPDLFCDEEGEVVTMVPVFGKDTPDLEDEKPPIKDGNKNFIKGGAESLPVEKNPTNLIGFRMPYDLPLVPYKTDDLPWCATSQYSAPDWTGRVWGGFERR